MNRLISYFARKGIFADLLTIATIAVGIGATLVIQRDVFPNVSFETITVTTPFPGASPEEAERLVTNRIEKDLREVDGIKKLLSVSAEGRSFIMLQLDPDQTDEETAKADVRDVVDLLLDDLPEDAEEPMIQVMESKNNPVIEVAVSGDMPKLELRKFAKQIEDELERVPGVAKIVSNGMRDIEVRVEADPAKLRQYAVTLDDIVAAISAQNNSIPGGTIEAPTNQPAKPELIVRTVGEYREVDEIKNTVVRANDLGGAIRVRDVAKIQMSLEKATILNRTDGKDSISLTVLKKEKADAITLVDEIRALVEDMEGRIDSRINFDLINDYSYYVRRRLKILVNNFGFGLTLVLIVLSLILPFRVALLTSVGIPFAFLGTFIVFWAFGISIHLISMFGLIIAVGMIVDDAIVVMDNTFRRIEEGEEPAEAAIRGTQEVWIPVTASVMTTILAFLPLMMMSGIMGKFVKYIPMGVIIALAISLIECYFILPHHIGRWIRPKKKDARGSFLLGRALKRTSDFWDQKVVPTYLNILKRFVNHRYWVSLGALGLFVTTLFLAIFVMKKSLFPKDGIEIFFIRTETPVGTSLARSEALLKPIEEVISKLPKEEMKNFVTTIGIQQQDPNDPFTKRGSEYAQITVYLHPEEERSRSAGDIINELKEKIGDTPKGFKRLVFERVNPGPPQGKPISIGIRGKTYAEILPAVEELKKRLSEREGVTDLSDSYVEGKKEVWVKIDEVEAAAAGVNTVSAGRTVRTAYEGTVASSIRKLEDDIDIRVSLNREARSRREALNQLFIRNQLGNLVPLSRIASTTQYQGIAAYEHEGYERQVKVTGEVDEAITTSTEVNGEVRGMIPEFKKLFPTVALHFGGEDEDTRESMQSLGIAFLLAFLGIFLVLVMTFENLHQPLLVMLITIPLGLMSVVWAFLIWQKPLSFLAFMGMVALAGIIVNNAIVFLTFVNQAREKGVNRFESIYHAARLRLRPIFLTTVTTTCGILPTAYGLGGLDPFVAPCAMALGWGVLVGAFLTTFVFPPAAAVFDDLSLCWQKITSRSKTAS